MNKALRHNTWKLRWLTQWDEVWDERFVSQWRQWLDSSFSAHVFFHPVLVRAWVDTYLPLRDIRPFFLIAQSSESKVFFPLVLWQRNWRNAFQRILVPVGHSDYDYHNPIVIGPKESFDWRSFWDRFAEEVLRAAPMRFDRLSLDGISKEFAGTGHRWRHDEYCPQTDLRAFNEPKDYFPSLKYKLRGDLVRRQRRIKETGELKFIVFSSSMHQEALRELPQFLSAHRRRWPNAYKPPHFHENLLLEGLKSGVVHFSTLRIGGQSAAWHLAFVYRDRFYSYMPSYEEEFEHFSPGKILLLKCYEDAITNNLKIFDHLRGMESYKLEWTDKLDPLASFTLDTRGLLRRFHNLAVDSVKPRLGGRVHSL